DAGWDDAGWDDAGWDDAGWDDAGWDRFLLFFQYMAQALGKHVIGVPAHYTSQECSMWHKIVKKSLSIRTHCCPFCTFAANRDHNAARNVLRKGLGYVNGARSSDARQFIAWSSHIKI
ncbi:MAG: transposase, partial [Desulfobacteraceae bacterium]|nr:transposase [Desulfobacteraceae bacterium]